MNSLTKTQSIKTIKITVTTTVILKIHKCRRSNVSSSPTEALSVTFPLKKVQTAAPCHKGRNTSKLTKFHIYSLERTSF